MLQFFSEISFLLFMIFVRTVLHSGL